MSITAVAGAASAKVTVGVINARPDYLVGGVAPILVVGASWPSSLGRSPGST